MATEPEDKQISAISDDFGDSDPESIRAAVRESELPEPVQTLADDYAEVVGIRDQFIWQWIYTLFPAFTLDSINSSAESRVRLQKTILTIFITTLDDIAEHERDKRTFTEARKHALPNQSANADAPDVDTSTVEFVGRVWTAFEDRFRTAPRYDQFRDIFRYDLRQPLNAMEYSWLLSKYPAVANRTGSNHYAPHNMVMFPYADVDLAHSPEFKMTDLTVLRETIWKLQRMARIGNWVSTWERELKEGDYSSGVLVEALTRGVISPTDLDGSVTDQATLVEQIRAAGIETELLEEWNNLYSAIKKRDLSAQSVDLDEFIDGMITVMKYHLATRGYK